MGLLSKEQILSASDLPSEDVDVKEWGGTVRVRTLTAGERDRFEILAFGETRENIRAKLIAFTAIDENGARLFSEEDVTALGAKSGRAMDRLWDAASKLSGLSKDDVKDLAKN